jgi:hypothetical protein
MPKLKTPTPDKEERVRARRGPPIGEWAWIIIRKYEGTSQPNAVICFTEKELKDAMDLHRRITFVVKRIKLYDCPDSDTRGS